MPKNPVPRDNEDRKAIREENKRIEKNNQDIPKGTHQPIHEERRWRTDAVEER